MNLSLTTDEVEYLKQLVFDELEDIDISEYEGNILTRIRRKLDGESRIEVQRCTYTHAHTRAFCGYQSCRES